MRRIDHSRSLQIGLIVAVKAIAAQAAIAQHCPGDLNGDGQIGATDLGALVGSWGPCGSGPCFGDVDGDGAVSARDVALLLTRWGACPPAPVWTPDLFMLDPAVRHPLAAVSFDDGSGAKLYVAEALAYSPNPLRRVLRWDEGQWTPLGQGMNSAPKSLVGFDSGNGPSLYAGGSFLVADGAPARWVARWNGAAWVEAGGGLPGSGVETLAVVDLGDGPMLLAAGSLRSQSGGFLGNHVFRLTGSGWSPLGEAISSSGTVYALAVFDDGTGPALYAGGGISTPLLSRLEDGQWITVSAHPGRVQALAVYDDGAGPALYAGGAGLRAATSNGEFPSAIARWSGAGWLALGNGINSGYPEVVSLTVHDDGSGPALYAAGRFLYADNIAARAIARWNGAAWSALQSGVDGEYPFVYDTVVHDDGHGPALFIAGSFVAVSGVDSALVARWARPPKR